MKRCAAGGELAAGDDTEAEEKEEGEGGEAAWRPGRVASHGVYPSTQEARGSMPTSQS